MQTYENEYGTVAGAADMAIRVTGHGLQLRAWAHRPGASWPCSWLARLDGVKVALDPTTGDLIDLEEYEDERIIDPDESSLTADELTAWIDDNLAGTPFAHLARNPQ